MKAAPMRLDHIVIAVHDLQRTAADYQALGFTVTPGGQHPGRTSHNALVVFADGAYLELIAWRASAPQERWWRDLQQYGDGPVDFALWPQDLLAATEAARADGLELTGPLAGSRTQPDGTEMHWQTARHATPDVPFLCADLTPRAWRVPEGEARQHANGATGVSSLAIAVADLGVTLPRYWALLGTQAVIDAPFVIPGSGLRIAQVQLDGLSLVLAEAAGAAPGTGALGHWLDTRGQGPCAFGLRIPGQPPQVLAAARSHGAVIETQAT